jgi:hypothetical protein
VRRKDRASPMAYTHDLTPETRTGYEARFELAPRNAAAAERRSIKESLSWDRVFKYRLRSRQ